MKPANDDNPNEGYDVQGHHAMTDINERLVALANSLGGTEEDDIMAGVAEIERLNAQVWEQDDIARSMRVEIALLLAVVTRLRALISDLLWAIGHDDEQILNETTARAKAALKDTTP